MLLVFDSHNEQQDTENTPYAPGSPFSAFLCMCFSGFPVCNISFPLILSGSVKFHIFQASLCVHPLTFDRFFDLMTILPEERFVFGQLS